MTTQKASADRLESNVRYYSRHITPTFATAAGSVIFDDAGNRYLDFLSACGSLNYGHNHPRMKRAAIDYLEANGVLNTMDLRTSARSRFMARFDEVILKPRGLDYLIQFTGPTGANAVEAAMKLSRKATGRTSIVAFTNGFHGVSLGALAATGNRGAREASRALLNGVVRLPYDGYHGAGPAELDRFAEMANDPSSGVERPAAFIVETVQGEGGLNVASLEWLQRLADIARRLDALLIVDEVQAGCGRTGRFFSFERAGLAPDLICMSKSLSGMGLPMAMLLVRPDRDVWSPAEHNGTFRGNNLAFVTAGIALDLWAEGPLFDGVERRSAELSAWAQRIVSRRPQLRAKGLGLMLGLSFSDEGHAEAAARAALSRGVIVETAGPRDEVLKLLPPLTIEPEILAEGLAAIEDAIESVIKTDAPARLVA